MAEPGTLQQTDGGTQADAGSRLSRLLMDLVALPPEDDAPEAPRLAPGDRLDRFEIRAVLGEGGFGTVYEAWDGELGRAVALKTLRARKRRDVPIDLLRREAEAVAKLNHPGIVTLHDLCAGKHGHYLVMERLEGRTLAEHLKERGALPWKDAVQLAGAMADALAHAHARGLLHRDLKPSNVFLCDDGRVKLLDFGLAYVLGSGSGSSGGTPAYMAPEQTRGEPVDARTDVYAIGLVIHEMNTGRRARYGDLLAATRGKEPPPLRRVPKALARLVARMTAPEASRRPADGAEVARELGRIRRAVEQRRPRLAVAALVVLAGASVAVAVLVPRLPPGRLLVAMADLENLAADPDLDGVGTLFKSALEQSRRVALIDRARVADLASVGSERPRVIGEPEAVAAGKLASAQLVLVPTVRATAGGLELAVRALDLSRGGAAIFGLRELAASREGLYATIDRLAVRVRRELAEDASEAPVRTVPVAEYAPADLEAVRLYEEGQRRASYAEMREAREAWEAAVARDPGFPLPRLALLEGSVGLFTWLELDRAGKANHVRALRRDLHRLPEGLRVWAETLLLRLEGGFDNHTAYVAALDRAIAARPEQAAPYLVAGAELLLRRGNAAAARPYVDRAVLVSPFTGLGDVVDLLVLSERFDEAVALARRWTELTPAPLALANVSIALLGQGDIAGAHAATRQLVAQDPGGALDRMPTMLSTYVDAGELAAWDELQARAPPRTPGYGYLHKAGRPRPIDLAVRGRIREALARLDAWRDQEPGSRDRQCDWHDRRLQVLLAREDAVAVEAGGRDMLRDCGPSSLLPWYLAEVGAFELSGRLAAGPSDGLLGFRMERALRSWKQGDAEAALAAFKAIASPPSHLHRGEILAGAGWHAEAVEAFRLYRRLRLAATGSPSMRLDVALLPRSFYLEAASLEALGDPEGARRALGLLASLLADADRDLPIVARAKALEARLARAP